MCDVTAGVHAAGDDERTGQASATPMYNKVHPATPQTVSRTGNDDGTSHDVIGPRVQHLSTSWNAAYASRLPRITTAARAEPSPACHPPLRAPMGAG